MSGTGDLPSMLLKAVSVLADWAAALPEIETLIVYGSRVRGDNRPDSDLDIVIWTGSGGDPLGDGRWEELHATDFASLRQSFPFPIDIAINPERNRETYAYISSGTEIPELEIGKVKGVRTARKS
ncbi:nucleotidyltransferase domain-containing protein [Aestuariivirga sp.]|uniref:nucleotidyltransferase domain-containing protein n=1 Tax=Aestuariivirga sp. TaxID=2650926 RepID=UPI00359366E6